MNSYRKLSALAAATTALTFGAAAGTAAAHTHAHDIAAAAVHAVFVQNDNPDGNAIAVYDRAAGGQLTFAGSYATGGKGGQLTGSVVDHVASQNSLVYDGDQRVLLAVNAGSDTVSVFHVDGDKLTLNQQIGSGGDFPVSIAVHGNLVYVLDARDGARVAGYWLTGGHLTAIPDSVRPLGLNPAATPEFVNTPGDVAFTPDGSRLIVTTKANGNNIDVFPVAPGGTLLAPTVNNEPGDVPFALAFEGVDQVEVSEAGTNAVQTFQLNGNNTLSPLASVATGQAATCWLVADGGVLFAGNAGSGSESSILDVSRTDLALSFTTSTDPGTVDATVAGDGAFLYVQTGLNGIVDEFQVGVGGSLTEIGSVTVPNAVGGEGIASS